MMNIIQKYKEKVDRKSAELQESEVNDKALQLEYESFIRGQRSILDAIKTEYELLCPNPSEFIARNATKCEFLNPNKIWFNNETRRYLSIYLDEDIPLGIDWRLCRWSIDDAKRIHGDV